MDRIDKIYNLEIYIRELKLIENDEKDRIYCKHDIEHFLDVSRVAYMINLEEKLGYDKEIIYAIGLLHDIGRHKEYESGLNHHIASVAIAEDILEQVGFSNEEIEVICGAIDNHRNEDCTNKLHEIIYKADKITRKCYACGSIDTCKWSDNKKNTKIEY